jgi:hypothetical protein
MQPIPVTTAATAICRHLIADPALDIGQKSLARQLLDFIDSVRADRTHDPFYEDCIRSLVADISGTAL